VTPRLLRSDMTGRWYIVTRYQEKPGGRFVAQTKYEVSADDLAAIRREIVERLRERIFVPGADVDPAIHRILDAEAAA
jgi:hypothetical protein